MKLIDKTSTTPFYFFNQKKKVLPVLPLFAVSNPLQDR